MAAPTLPLSEVSGCSHAVVGIIVNGNYVRTGENHGLQPQQANTEKHRTSKRLAPIVMLRDRRQGSFPAQASPSTRRQRRLKSEKH